MITDREKWDARYLEREAGAARSAEVLAENLHLLPAAGRALDLASGLGGNALLLAERGLETHAWDLSPVAMDKLTAEAARRGLNLRCTARDVVAEPPPEGEFDVIVVAHFLERALCPAIAAALRPGGLLFYQSFTRARPDGAGGPQNEAFRLAENELLRLFPALAVRYYREEGLAGEVGRGLRGVAQLVAQRG